MAYSLAFGYEHPSGATLTSMDRITNILNYARAHMARLPPDTGIHTLSIAYGNQINYQFGAAQVTDIPQTFGTNAVNRQSKPRSRASKTSRHGEHAWRAQYAYPTELYPNGLPGSELDTEKSRPVTQCAEMISLPTILRSIEHIPNGTPIVIVSLTIHAGTNEDYETFQMCDNCRAYAEEASRRRVGLSFIDAGFGDVPITDGLIESRETVNI